MRNRLAILFLAPIAFLIFSPRVQAQQTAPAKSPAVSGENTDQKFDPRRDLNGTWIGVPGTKAFRNFTSSDQKTESPTEERFHRRQFASVLAAFWAAIVLFSRAFRLERAQSSGRAV